MDLTLHQLRLLREVAHRTTIAAAAESLGYTPSAVSQQLAGLERTTGVAVLERVGRNVRLTDAGRELVRHADDLIAGMEAAQVALERVNGEAQGRLVMTVYESVAATLLPPLLTRLGAEHPGIELRTRQLDPDVALDSLALGEIDLAFSIDYPHAPGPPRPDIETVTVLDDRFHVVVPIDDPLPDGALRLEDVADRKFIASPPALSCGRCVVHACRAAGFEPDIVHQLDDYPTSLHLVAAGHGVALVPDLGLERTPPGVRVLPLEPQLLRRVQLAYRASSAERPAIVAVRELLLEIASGVAAVAA